MGNERTTLPGAETEEIKDLNGLRASIQAEALEIYPALKSQLPEAVTKVGLLRDSKLSLAGGFQIASAKDLKFEKMIIESCSTPSTKQMIAQTTETTEHILLVQNCENQRLDYSGFIKSGPIRFAEQNRSVKFAYLHRASLKLANKMISNFDLHTALTFDSVKSSTSKDAKFLGLDQQP